MSGKYLHGLIVNGDFVDVRDNIFSHSELRQLWSVKNSEQPNKNIKEWSWDYVTREFVETPEDLILMSKKWIKKNINSHKQLIRWVDRNWEGLVNGDEKERELYIWQLIDHKAKYKNKLVQKFLKANSDWQKANSDWQKANSDWQKANSDWRKADSYWQKADSYWQKADSDWQKANSDWQKAYSDWQKADPDWQKAYSDWQKAYSDRQKADSDRQKANSDWQKAYSDWQKADSDRQKANSDWRKADKKWKTFTLKPVFMDLLKKYPNKYWKEKTNGK